MKVEELKEERFPARAFGDAGHQGKFLHFWEGFGYDTRQFFVRADDKGLRASRFVKADAKGVTGCASAERSFARDVRSGRTFLVECLSALESTGARKLVKADLKGLMDGAAWRNPEESGTERTWRKSNTVKYSMKISNGKVFRSER